MLSVVFCKHKTAYEMRISDWIADVCSSVLGGFCTLAALAGQPVDRFLQAAEQRSLAGEVERQAQPLDTDLRQAEVEGLDRRHQHDLRSGQLAPLAERDEIGRAHV